MTRPRNNNNTNNSSSKKRRSEKDVCAYLSYINMFSTNSLYCKVAEQMCYSVDSLRLPPALSLSAFFGRSTDRHTPSRYVGACVCVPFTYTHDKIRTYMQFCSFFFLAFSIIWIIFASTKSVDDHQQQRRQVNKQKFEPYTTKTKPRRTKNTDRFKCLKHFFLCCFCWWCSLKIFLDIYISQHLGIPRCFFLRFVSFLFWRKKFN